MTDAYVYDVVAAIRQIPVEHWRRLSHDRAHRCP
jgi:hypothetical protein